MKYLHRMLTAPEWISNSTHISRSSAYIVASHDSIHRALEMGVGESETGHAIKSEIPQGHCQKCCSRVWVAVEIHVILGLQITAVLVGAFIAVINTMARSNLGRTFYFSLKLSGHAPSLREVKAGVRRWELKQRPWLAPPAYLYNQDHLTRARPAGRWALPCQPLTQKMPGTLAYRPVCWGTFSQKFFSQKTLSYELIRKPSRLAHK